jgi:hypothetical protein
MRSIVRQSTGKEISTFATDWTQVNMDSWAHFDLTPLMSYGTDPSDRECLMRIKLGEEI